MNLVTRSLRDALDVIEYAITGNLRALVTLQASADGYVIRSYISDCDACRTRPEADRQIRLREDCVISPTTGHRFHAHRACYDFEGFGPDRAR